MKLTELVRPHIRSLASYSGWRDNAGDMNACTHPVLLDANENPYDNGVNRYPDPFQTRLKEALSAVKGIPAGHIFLGNGSDEILDMCYRIFCEPGTDAVVAFTPTFSMYKGYADINGVKFIEVPLEEDYSLRPDKMFAAAAQADAEIPGRVKLMFICNPNNPTANTVLSPEQIRDVAGRFEGIVILDEAYIDFSSQKSMLDELDSMPNVIILQTLSKAWGMAGLRIGMALASEEIIRYFNAVKHPYNISTPVVNEALRLLGRNKEREVKRMVSERNRIAEALTGRPGIIQVFPSDTNFLLIKVEKSEELCRYMFSNGIVIQDRTHSAGCEGCIRLSVGTPEQNDCLLSLFAAFYEGGTQMVPPRTATLSRKTGETDIRVSVDLDNAEVTYIDTGIGFFDHMLDQIARHAAISLRIIADGDIEVDEHHTMEDVAIALGQAMRTALGDKRGLERYGFALPMDESRALVLIDFGGRADLEWDVKFPSETVGGVHIEMFRHFFASLSEAMQCNLQISARGDNSHHLAEAVFKAFARALRRAIRRDTSDAEIPSSKGILF